MLRQQISEEAEQQRVALEAELERQRLEHETGLAKEQVGKRVKGRWSRAVASSAKITRQNLLKEAQEKRAALEAELERVQAEALASAQAAAESEER